MKATRVTIRASVDPLADAIRLGPSLVGPADGYSSYDCRLVCYLDELGRPSLTPTAEVHAAYTFWRSCRGHYKLVRAQDGRAVPALNLSLWGEA